MPKKYITIAEAKKVKIPDLPPTFFTQLNELMKTVQFGNENAVSKLRKIYALTDAVTAFIAPYMVCEKGCFHCCRIDVNVTYVEAQYIRKNRGIAPASGHSISSGHTDAKSPCTFLDTNGYCSIYEHRPFACRTFHAMDDPSLCEDVGTPHVTYTSKSNSVFKQLFHMVAFINNNEPIRDIRDFFPNRNS